MKITNTLSAITLALSGLSLSSHAQLANNSDNWQTFETENFRVHYTENYKQWALSSARELEEVRKLVKQQQGRVLQEKVDAYVIDSYNSANGFAVPLSNKPYMALFTTPPLSDSIIANATSWQQILVLHEYVHLVHLAQQSRSKLRNNVSNWFDIYEASQIKGERWVAEGYATLLESQMTGAGRLFNNHVEAILQQFARQGALPSYEQLSTADDNFMSGSMAYIVGVRYLKWLEDNYGKETLDAVWTRWSAVKNRTFHQAFSGVFPDSAKNLYQRFVAEYTYKAMAKEAEFSSLDSKLWMDLSGYVDAPTLNPRGEQLAVVETQIKDGKAKVTLNVYSTKENTEKAEEFEKNTKELLAKDPLDIADKAPEVFKRKQLFTLNQTNKRGIKNPRWLNDDTIIFGSTSLNGKNEFHKDLFIWQLSNNKVTQLTRGENLRRFDIAPDGQSIIAERSRYGQSQLVRISLADNNKGTVIEEITSANTNQVYDFPRFKPTNNSTQSTELAYLVSTLNNKWALRVKDLKTNEELAIPLPTDYQYLSFPEWSKDGEYIYYVAGKHGVTKLYQYHIADNNLSAISSGEQAVTWPTIDKQNNLLHLAISPNGPDIYQVNLAEVEKSVITNTTVKTSIDKKQASKYVLADASMAVDETLGENSNYGVGPQEGTITLGESYYSASSSMFELGFKSGDILERFDWQVNISQDVFDNILSGYAASLRWQGWPVKLLAHGYQFDLKTDKQYSDALTFGKIKEKGLFVEASYPFSYETFSIDSFVQAKYQTLEKEDSYYLSAGFRQHWSLDKQTWGIKQSFTGQFMLGDQDNQPSSYQGSNGSIDINGHFNHLGLGFSYTWAERSKDAGNILSLGGYTSTLMQNKAHLNKQLTPELAFYQQVGNDYQSYQAYIPFEFGQLFYRRHDMNEQEQIDSYGISGTVNGSFGFTGINNISLNLGVAQVNPENSKSETHGWIGLSHQW